MEQFDVAIVGAGPAGSTCAAFCAKAGLRAVLIEREKFPREKVCGDCLNPSCWPVLERLEIARRVRDLAHARLECVEFIAINGQKVIVDLPRDQEIAIKRSLFDQLLVTRARELGAEIREETTVTALARNSEWKINSNSCETLSALILAGADGRNSTVARLCNFLPRSERERIALQTHVPLPRDFGKRVVLQLLAGGYSGQSPVDDAELNVCLVARPQGIGALKSWATKQFGISSDHAWRTITPLTRAPISPAHESLFFIGDAARVVEPFTGEGIYYALRSGELAANTIVKLIRGEDRRSTLGAFAQQYAAMYRRRLWINHFARRAVTSPRLGSLVLYAARVYPAMLRMLTAEIVKRG
jgi:geranylgeranyl reductase family protein